MAYPIIYSDDSEKQLKKFDKPIKEFIEKKLKKLAENPLIGKPLRYDLKDCFSLRVGKFRVIYKIHENTINITEISHRKDIYSMFK